DPTPDSKLAVNVVAFETNTYSINATLVVRRTADRLEQWQLATYARIRAALEARLQEYKETVAELKAQAEAQVRAAEAATPFGQAPSQNRETIRRELKKHCITILTRQTYDDFDATKDGAPGAPPYFDVDEAAREGAIIRLFEQAFEWDQLQYVFYPYFWARKGTWIERFTRQDTDPEFRDFWQAGAARVVVPARPGFEVALTHFLETGKLWNGEGNPPDISSPMYVSIVDEIKQRTDAGQDEIAVGEPWDVRVPTPLLLVRSHADLPRWQRADPDEWDWHPVEDVTGETGGGGLPSRNRDPPGGGGHRRRGAPRPPPAPRRARRGGRARPPRGFGLPAGVASIVPVQAIVLPSAGWAQLTWFEDRLVPKSAGRVILRFSAPPWHQTGVQPFAWQWVKATGKSMMPVLLVAVARNVTLTQASVRPGFPERPMHLGASPEGAGFIPGFPIILLYRPQDDGLVPDPEEAFDPHSLVGEPYVVAPEGLPQAWEEVQTHHVRPYETGVVVAQHHGGYEVHVRLTDLGRPSAFAYEIIPGQTQLTSIIRIVHTAGVEGRVRAREEWEQAIRTLTLHVGPAEPGPAHG